MPRAARNKSTEAMYHIMCRSISETDLFRSDEDKTRYIFLLKKYSDKFQCRIYAYCMMSNHLHFYINPCGFDISSFMKHLNSAYVVYYNRRYSRRGHLFQERFASTIVDSSTYSLTLSAYIHNNAKDLPEFSGKEELYPYSSYGIYTGHRKDREQLVDTRYLLEYFSKTKEAAAVKYIAFTQSMKDTGIMKEVDSNIIRDYIKNEYRSEKRCIIRFDKVDEAIQKIDKALSEKVEELLKTKHCRETVSTRAFTTYVMKTLCGCTYKDICQYIGNITVSGVSRLSNQGYRLFTTNSFYKNAFYSIIQAG
jgi:putative transposase